MTKVSTIPFQKTGYFSKTICDYLSQNEGIQPFTGAFPTIENFKKQVNLKRTSFSAESRSTLVSSLKNQYKNVKSSKLTFDNIESLADEISEEFMGETRFEGMPMGQVQDSLDLINVMGIDIAQSYAKTIIEFRGPSQDLQSYHLIDRLNRRTLQLTNIVNIDFVEFIQVLIEFIKSSEYYGELN